MTDRGRPARSAARRGRSGACHAILWLVVGVAMATTGTARQPALPDREAFFAEIRANLARARREQYFYAYTERSTELRRNPFGRVGTAGTRAFRVLPLPDGTGLTRTLIEQDGEPVEDGDVETIEYERRDEDVDDRPTRSILEDVYAVLRFTLDRRESLHGRDHVVVVFEPRPGERAQTDVGSRARRFRGTIWVDEAAREVARVEAVAVESLSMGFGLVARLGEGATVTLEREPVADGVWMPISLRFTGEGRAFLFVRRLTLDHMVEWFDYERVPVDVPD